MIGSKNDCKQNLHQTFAEVMPMCSCGESTLNRLLIDSASTPHRLLTDSKTDS